MTDKEFLTWIRDRLVYVYHEPPNVDFILKLTDLINEMDDYIPARTERRGPSR